MLFWRTSLPCFTFSSDLLIADPKRWRRGCQWMGVAATNWYDKPCGSFLIPSIFYFRCSRALGFQFKFPSPWLWRVVLAYLSEEKKPLVSYIEGLQTVASWNYNMYVIFYAQAPNPSLESPPICIIQLKQRRIKRHIYVTSQWGHAIMSNCLHTWRYLLFSILVAWAFFLTRRMPGVIIDSYPSSFIFY